MTIKRWRIAWRAIATGATGHGTGLFTLTEAQDIVKGLQTNLPERRRDEGWSHVPMSHWPEQVSWPRALWHQITRYWATSVKS